MSWRGLLRHNWVSTGGWNFRAAILLDNILTMLKKFILNIEKVVFWTKRITFFSSIWCVLRLRHSSRFFNRWGFKLRVCHLFFLNRRDFLRLIWLSYLLSVFKKSFLWKLLVCARWNLLQPISRYGCDFLTWILLLYRFRLTWSYIAISTKASCRWKLRCRIRVFLNQLLLLGNCWG